MNISLEEIRAEVMASANKLRREKGLNKSEALRLAWAEEKEIIQEAQEKDYKKFLRYLKEYKEGLKWIQV